MGAEAAAFSAHEQLDNLIIMYDSNDVTLDKMAEFTMSEDTAMRYKSYGWDVVTVDGHDLEAVSKVRNRILSLARVLGRNSSAL